MGMRNMWPVQGPASSLNCLTIFALEFQSIENESPLFYWGEEAFTSYLNISISKASESLFPKLTLKYMYGLGPDSLHLRKLMLPSLESPEKFCRINQVAPWLSLLLA